jgi:predicted alpha/beta-hydrolase family hydrolase
MSAPELDGLLIDGPALRVVRFEFDYMAQRRRDGRRRPPDRAPRLVARWRAVVAALGGPRGLAIGGKSLGGRMATLLAAELEAESTPPAAVVCLGYPFHPPGKPERLRTAHLAELRTPCLICQGTRDPFGGRDEVAGYTLSPALRLHWAEDGDHRLRPRKASGLSEADNWAAAMAAISTFLAELS